MPGRTRIAGREVQIGGLSRPELMRRLDSHSILLNVHAETLLQDVVFDERDSHPVMVTERTVAELGLSHGATLPQIFEAAQRQGLLLCPMDAGPYLRMVWTDQTASRDSVMSSGRAPEGGLTVAAEAFRADHEYPKGFYLRVVDGHSWLRGYRCDDQHLWSPADRFIFQLPPPSV
ncbi:hypothetical protein [Arthrobacter sp. ZGTC212]|uniref:hypothetical protein n=1 Tax=Arthrobacter sp. ZGTC212 TaxID=2058899 RepID=UPI000CE3C168|nr:hypothetical protein [Arthrobacter sp. ZGTC212]